MSKAELKSPILKKKLVPLGKKSTEEGNEAPPVQAPKPQQAPPPAEEEDEVPGPKAGNDFAATLKPLGLCPTCQQFMFRPDDGGEDFCPACSPPSINPSKAVTFKGRPIRTQDAPPPAPYETIIPKSERIGPYTAFKGFNAFLPKKTKRGSWALRCRQVHTGGQWNDNVSMPRDQQALIRTGIAYDETFTKNCHLIQGIASLDLDGQDCLIATKHEIVFNQSIIEVDGEVCVAFYLHGTMAKIKQGDFVAEMVPLAVLPT